MTIEHLFLIAIGIVVFFTSLLHLLKYIEEKKFGIKANVIPRELELKDFQDKIEKIKTRFHGVKTQDALDDQRFKDLSKKFDRINSSIKKKTDAHFREAEKEALKEESEELVLLMKELFDMQGAYLEQSGEIGDMIFETYGLSAAEHNVNVNRAEKETFDRASEELNFLKDEISKANDVFSERTDRIFNMLEETTRLIEKTAMPDMQDAGKEVFPETFEKEPDLRMTEPLKDMDEEQLKTLARARLHLLFAIISLLAGLACVIGGVYILAAAKQTMVLVAGGIIIVIGGTTAAIISKIILSGRRFLLDISMKSRMAD